MREVGRRTWELRLTIGKWEDGRPRAVHRYIKAKNHTEATDQLVAFVEEMKNTPLPDVRQHDLTVEEAMERYLTEYLAQDKGRADKTISDYVDVASGTLGLDGANVGSTSDTGSLPSDLPACSTSPAVPAS